jgi:hypothetical protein
MVVFACLPPLGESNSGVGRMYRSKQTVLRRVGAKNAFMNLTGIQRTHEMALFAGF